MSKSNGLLNGDWQMGNFHIGPNIDLKFFYLSSLNNKLVQESISQFAWVKRQSICKGNMIAHTSVDVNLYVYSFLDITSCRKSYFKPTYVFDQLLKKTKKTMIQDLVRWICIHCVYRLYTKSLTFLRVKIDIPKWQLLEEACMNEEPPHLQLLPPFGGNKVKGY